MQNMRGRKVLGPNTQAELMYEDLKPSMDWAHDSNAHTLNIDLPGFKKEGLKVQVDNNRRLTAYGERQVAEGRYKRFMHIFTAPEDSNIDKITAKFEHGILSIIMPMKMEKKAVRDDVEAPKASSPRAKAADRKEEIPSSTGITTKTEEFLPSKAGAIRDTAIAKEKVAPLLVENAKDPGAAQEVCGAEDRCGNGKGSPEGDYQMKEHEKKVRFSEKGKEEERNSSRVSASEEHERLPSRAEGTGDGREKKDWEGDAKMGERVWSLIRINDKLKGGLGLEEGIGESLLDMARKNKEVIGTAIVAFTIGFYVSQKLRSSG